MNDRLRRALADAHLDEIDVASHLDVDPKTVREWVRGRVPYPRNRRALADLIGLAESELWPSVLAPQVGGLHAVYPHQHAVPAGLWAHLVNAAVHEIDILGYEDVVATHIGVPVLTSRADSGVRVRILQSGGDLTAPQTVEIRTLGVVQYNSILRADADLLVSTRLYGVPTGEAPVFQVRHETADDVASLYVESFERAWRASLRC